MAFRRRHLLRSLFDIRMYLYRCIVVDELILLIVISVIKLYIEIYVNQPLFDICMYFYRCIMEIINTSCWRINIAYCYLCN